MLSSLIYLRSQRDAIRHLCEAVSAIWSHKGGKKRGFVVQFNHVESFRDIFKRGSFSWIIGMVYTGLQIALFIIWLGSIHILMFPLGFSFTSIFNNQSVGCVNGLIVSLSQS